jgi:hypothetical protein
MKTQSHYAPFFCFAGSCGGSSQVLFARIALTLFRYSIMYLCLCLSLWATFWSSVSMDLSDGVYRAL